MKQPQHISQLEAKQPEQNARYDLDWLLRLGHPIA